MIRAVALAAVASGLMASAPASAQDAIATAPAAGRHDAPDASANPLAKPLNERQTSYDDTGPPILIGPCGPTAPAKDGKGPDHQAHGQIDAAVGTNGYRSISGVVCQPLGDHAAVTIAAGQNQWRGRAWGR